MAKEGIESLLLDCHTNDNVAEIEAEFGIKGFAVLVRLWQKIYAEKGYYCEWVERSPLLFLANWFGGNSGVDVNLINEVVTRGLENGIFNNELYEKYKILTSRRIQKQYFDVVKRRTEINYVEEYLLISVPKCKGNVNKISISADINAKNVCRNSISKVKESKGKVSKEREKGKKVAFAPPSLENEVNEEQREKEATNKNADMYIAVVTYLNERAGTSFRANSRKTQSLINARINEGYSLDDFKRVIDVKWSEWGNNTEMCKYIRPETLFGTKFESYLNQAIAEKKKTFKGLKKWEGALEL